MHKNIRRALLIAAVYIAGSYFLDRPVELKHDVVALREMSTKITEPERATKPVEHDQAATGQTIFDAKHRLDSVRGKVQNSIALGTERFARQE